MAQFWTDFAADTVDSAPSGWTLEGFLVGECTVVEAAGARGGKELSIAPTTNARRTAVWNLPGSVANAEILIRMRTPTATAARYPVMFRKNSSGASLQCYTLKMTYTDGLRGGRYNTSYADLGTAEVAKSGLYNFDQPTKYFYLRVRIQGSSYKAKAWNADVAEPATWDIEVDDSTLASAGGVGIFAYYSSGGMFVDSFGVGTDGDTAPDAAVVSEVADFTASPTTGVNPLAVQFSDASTNATSWAWNFGDGQTSNQQTPTHTYTTPGAYSVTLTINGGASSKTRTSYIAVSDANAPTLSGDFEGGNINVPASSVVSSGADWTVNLVPRKQQNDYIATPAWWYFAVRLDKMLGKRPAFNLAWTDWVGKVMSLTAPKAGWVPCYSYTPDDPSSWVYAPSISWADPTVSWQFAEAFAQDVVYVSYRPICTPSMLRTWVEGLAGVSNLAGKANFVVATLPATMDEAGRTIPAQDILGFMFGHGPAQMVITSGVHPCEDHGTQVMQGFVEAMLASPKMLSEFTVMVYPCVNPQGRWGRSYRGSFDPAGPTKDPARDWTDTPTLSCVQHVRSDIAARCSGGRPDIMFDFHGHYQHGYSHSVYGWNAVAANWTIEQAYQLAVLALQPGLERSTGASATQPTPYFSGKASGGPAGAFIIIEISDWLTDQHAASRAFGSVLAGQLEGITDDVYGRWPIGAVGVVDARAQANRVSIAMGSVNNAVLYRVLRDGQEIRAYAPEETYTDSSVEPGMAYSYAYQARNPGGQTVLSVPVQVTLPLRSGNLPWGVEAWGGSSWSADVTPWGE